MNIIKKWLIIMIMCFVIIMFIIPSFSYAGSLSDAQRKALVDVVVSIIDNGNKNRILRYSQDHRKYGYDWRKVTTSTKQTTVGYVNLTEADLLIIKGILASDLGIDYDEMQMPVVRSYFCKFLGDDINDTIPFDCSSLCSAAYNMTVGTNFGNWPWVSGNFSKNSNFFEVSSNMSNVKPGDVVWKKGHVAIYLGDYKNTGVTYIAEASGFAKISKSSEIMRQRLLAFLQQNPKYIADHPNYNQKQPTLQLPESGIMDATKQVVIKEYNPNTSKRFDKYATYIGPISAGRAIDVTNLTTTNPGDGSGATDSSTNTIGGENSGQGGVDHDPIVLPGNNVVFWPEDLVLEEQILATSAGYFYKGTPTYGQYIGRVELFNWLIEAPENVLDWLIGAVTYGVKAVIIGWTALLENVMSNILNFGITSPSNSATALLNSIKKLEKVSEQNILAYSGKENNEKLNSVATVADTATSTSTTVSKDAELDANAEKKKRITIEDILFNRVPILDINFFDFEKAGGQKISSDSLLYKIRESIASWYYTFRMIVIIFMLIALIYLAIKIAISSAIDKAEYKAKLIDWLIGFIIVFSIHYFMIAIIYLNNQIVKLLDPIITSSTTVETPNVETSSNSNITTQNDGQTSLYEAIRIQAYDIRAVTGFTATIIYMVLVFFMIRFLIFYAKRLFTIVVLTVFAPIMGLLYSINKEKYKIEDWGKEYIFNVLIQFVHVVIYTVIVSLAFELTKTSTFIGGLIALMALNFMLIAEGIVKKIFGFNKATSSGNLIDNAITGLVGYNVGKTLFNKGIEKGNNVLSGNSKIVNWLNNKYNSNLSKNISFSDWENKYSAQDNETEEEARERRAQKVLHSKGTNPNTGKLLSLLGKEPDYLLDKNGVPITPDYYGEFDPNKRRYFTMSSINNRIEEAMREEKKARTAYALQSAKDISNSLFGLFSLTASIPMIVISPKYGLGLGAYGIHALTSSMGRRKIKGAKSDDNERRWTGKRLMFAFSTAGMSEGIRNMYKNSEDNLYVLETDYPMKLEILKKQRILEDQLARQIIALELSKGGSIRDNDIEQSEKKFKDAVKEIDKKEFERAVDLTLEKVKTKDIEKAVKEHIISMKKVEFTTEDIEQITMILEKSVEKNYKAIRINQNFTNVVRDEIRDRVVEAGHYTVVDEKQKSSNKHEQGNGESNSSEDIRKKYSRKNDEKSTQNGTKDNNDNNSNLKAKVHIKDDYNTKNERNITKEELEDKIDELLKDINQEELIEIIESALERKEAINREVENPKLKSIMKTISELSENNIRYKELTNEDIYKLYTNNNGKLDDKYDSEGNIKYQDVSTLVKNMRKYLVDYIDGKV